MTTSLGRRRRVSVLALAAAAFLLWDAAPANAHVEAEAAAGAQAGDGPVSIKFTAEAESSTAGIVSAKTQLPAGVLPEWVSLAGGPTGWTLTPTADGYEVGGPALAPRQDAVFTIVIGQLPANLTEFPLKTLLRYSDGKEDAWIEEATQDDPEPDNPAPIVTVAAAAGQPSDSPGASASATTDPATTAAATSTRGSSGSTLAGVLVVGVLVLVAAAVGLWYRRLRSRARS